MKKINKGQFRFILFLSLFLTLSFSCQRVMDDGEEDDVSSSDGTALKIMARSGGNTSIEYPVYLYAFNEKGDCAAKQKITSEEVEMNLQLPSGNFKVVALSGVSKGYVMSDNPKISDVITMQEGGNTKKGVMLTTGGLIGNKASSNTGEKWGLIDKTGKEILKTNYEAMGDLNKKLIYVLKGKKFGFIDSAGNIIVKPTYNFIGSFNNQGICWVNIGGKYDKKNNMVSKGKFGLINENGREIIPAKYEDVGNFPVLRDKKTGALLDEAAFYTKADQSAFPATKQEIQSLLLPKPHAAESQLPSSRVDYFYFINKKSQGLVDIHGNTIIPLTANQAILPPSDNMLRLAKVEKKQIAKAYYDLDAEVMVRISSSEKGKFGAFSHNLAPVSLDDELYFIDKKGNKVIGGLSKAFLSNEGYRVVQKGSAFGAIDSTGAVVIPIEYTNSLTSVNNGRLGVQKNASWFYVDMKGQIVSDKYDRIGNFHQGYASVCLNKLWGAIDLQNRVVVPLEWQGVAPIVDPKLIWVKKDNLYYLYDGVQKSVRLKQGFANASNFDNEMAYVMSDGKWGIIDPDGKVLVPCLFEKEEDMVLAKQYMLAEDKKNLTEVEALRVIARFDPDTNMFKITSVIPDKHWDY